MLSGLIAEHVAGGGMAILTSHQSMPLPNGKVLKI
jgi:heme exporter protein A